jgi:hypothetical protein
MLLMLHGKHLTEQGCEIMMVFFNIVLAYLNLEFRFPKRLPTFISRMQFNQTYYNGIKTFVSCGNCHAIYDIPKNNDDRKKQHQCTFKLSYSTTTGNPLRTCENDIYRITKVGKLVPRYTFVYNSVISTLKTFFKRSGFMESINSWRSRKLQKNGHLFDIMDGDVWKSFKVRESDSRPFVESSDSNLLFSLNVDWYQPFQKGVCSIGAIYMTILNLGRQMRNLRSNVILVGLMPGPKEPSLSQINNYLNPLVDELKTLLNGVEMKASDGSLILVRGALLIGVSDLPAAAKVFGFSSHNSFFSCRRCDHAFPAISRDNSQRDFSGSFDGHLNKRTNESNRRNALCWKDAKNDAERQRLTQANGTRWSSMHDLPYFDLVRNTVYDPMHNMYLGSFKRIIEAIFLKMNFFSRSDVNNMSKMVKNIIMPFGIDISSLSRKMVIGDGFSYLKADEWRIFVLFLSPLLFKSRLPMNNYNNWIDLVDAVTTMSMNSISILDARKCHDKLVAFCKGFEALYGKDNLYPNIHYHIHLFEQMLDFGPWHTHHAFAYERYNQDLKAAKTNNKGSIEVTIAKKFIQTVHHNDFFVDSISNLEDGVPTLKLKAAFLGLDIHGNIESYEDNYLSHELEISKSDDYDLMEYIRYAGSIDNDGYVHAYGFEPLPYCTVRSLKINQSKSNSFLNEENYRQLVSYYQVYFDQEGEKQYIFGVNDDINTSIDFDKIVKVEKLIARFKSIDILGQKYSSIETASAKGSYVKAYYRDINLMIEEHVLRPAQIQFFFRHSIKLLNEQNELEIVTFTFAYVRWYKTLDPGSHVTTYDSINSYCYSNTFLDISFMDILPVQCIHSPIGIYIDIFDNCNIVIDIPRKIQE